VSRRGFALATAAVVALAGGGAGAVALLQRGAAAGDEPSAQLSTAAVERRTLQVVDELSGQLGHGATRPVYGELPGTVTESAAAGDTVDRGDMLFAVDEWPVTLLFGEEPVWRAMGDGMTGGDVRQLEENLVALGFGEMTPDDTFDEDTTTAVEAWQAALGVTEDGVVNLGEVVFLPDAAWIAKTDVAVGGRVSPGMPVLETASTDRLVTANLPASEREDVTAGDSLLIELSDGTKTSGLVEEVGTTVETAQDGSQSVTLTIRLADAAAALSDGPVSISIVRFEHADVLAVPVDSLLALLEGGYAVEKVTDADAGTTDLVGVEVGLFADGWVEITSTSSGELSEGDEVVVP
jgi:peptidoglycan hydrolase-like protein with peptidoglycan-binding domain